MTSALQRLGSYQLLAEIGHGGMGTVFRAVDPIIGRPVAIKVIRLLGFNDPEELAWLRERLFREARSAGLLSHPGIVTVYQVGQEQDVAYVAMEFVEGETLEKILSAGPPARDFTLNVLRQTAAALDYAHSNGIVHRDIKPANLILRSDGVVKVADFGIAKVSSAQRSTQTGIILGTPYYMSPEQVQAKPVDGRSDQFSLAVVAYQMLTGARPFSADTLTSLCYKIVYEQPELAHEVNPALALPIAAALNKALAKDPAARYTSCTEFATALEAACSSRPSIERPPPAPVERPCKWRRWLVPATLLLIALLAGAGFLARRHSLQEGAASLSAGRGSRRPLAAPAALNAGPAPALAPPALPAPHPAPLTPRAVTAGAAKLSPAPPAATTASATGALVWTGQLTTGAILAIDESWVSSGVLVGQLPGAPVRIAAYPAEKSASGMIAFTPRAATRKSTPGVSYVWDPRRALDITIWELPGPQNAWKRLALRCGSRSLSAVVIEWTLSGRSSSAGGRR